LKVEIVSKMENKLLDRVEVNFKIDHDGESTPSRDAVKTALAGSLDMEKDLIVVSDMASKYGVGSTEGYAKAYFSAESAKKYERNHLLVRNKLAEKKQKAAKAKKKK